MCTISDSLSYFRRIKRMGPTMRILFQPGTLTNPTSARLCLGNGTPTRSKISKNLGRTLWQTPVHRLPSTQAVWLLTASSTSLNKSHSQLKWISSHCVTPAPFSSQTTCGLTYRKKAIELLAIFPPISSMFSSNNLISSKMPTALHLRIRSYCRNQFLSSLLWTIIPFLNIFKMTRSCWVN